jgi:hypothetical protein
MSKTKQDIAEEQFEKMLEDEERAKQKRKLKKTAKESRQRKINIIQESIPQQIMWGFGIPYLTEEGHPMGFNYLGPGTQLAKRFSLNSTSRIGSTSPFLPTSKLDYQAFLHDLLYYSPNDLIKAWADDKLLKSLKDLKDSGAGIKTLVNLGIEAQYKRRLTNAAIDLGLITAGVYESGPAFLKQLRNVYTNKKFEDYILKPMNFERFSAGKLFNPRTGTMPQPIKDVFAKMGVRGTRRGRQDRTLFSAARAIFPVVWFAGVRGLLKPFAEFKYAYDRWSSAIESTKEFKKQINELEKVKKAYDKYLDEVSNVVDGQYLIKKNINERQAQRAYIKFFREYRKYLSFNKKQYEDNKEYKEQLKNIPELVNLPELNTKNLNQVSNPAHVKAPTIILEGPKVEKVKEELKKEKPDFKEIEDILKSFSSGKVTEELPKAKVEQLELPKPELKKLPVFNFLEEEPEQPPKAGIVAGTESSRLPKPKLELPKPELKKLPVFNFLEEEPTAKPEEEIMSVEIPPKIEMPNPSAVADGTYEAELRNYNN